MENHDSKGYIVIESQSWLLAGPLKVLKAGDPK
jgi:hypothetical protein